MHRLMAPLATLAALTTATLFPSTSFSQVAQASPAQVPLSAASAPAPTVQPLTLAEAIRLALQFSPQIVANQHPKV